MTHNGTVISGTSVFSSTTTRAQLTAAGATCDCAYGEEVHWSYYHGFLSAGGSGLFSDGRLPACMAEPVEIIMPAVSCPASTGGGGGTDALLIAHMGGTDSAPTWSANNAAHACLTDVVSQCPAGYSRSPGSTPTDAFTGITPHNCTATVINPALSGPVSSSASTYALNTYSRLGYYVSSVQMYGFPSTRPSTAVCPDGSDLDANNKCPATFTPLKVYQRKADLANDYTSGYLSSNGADFFGSATTPGNYYTDNYNPTPADPLSLNTTVPSAAVEIAYPLLAGHLANTTVGKAMIAQRTAWNQPSHDGGYTTLPHLDGRDGHLCQNNSWDGWALRRGKPYIDDAEAYLEDGVSCPANAPYDTTKRTCVYKSNIELAGPVPPNSIPSSSWCSGTNQTRRLITGSDGRTIVGEYCAVSFNLDTYRTVTPPHTDICVVTHDDYPNVLYPPAPATPTNIPQNVFDDCMQFPPSFPATPPQVSRPVSYYPQTLTVTYNLAHNRLRDRATKTSTPKYRVATITTPTIRERKVTGHACRAGTLYGGWFGSPGNGGDDWGDMGLFCAEDPPGPYGNFWDKVWPSMCDGSPPAKPTQPSGTLTVGGMGISTSTDPTGPIVEVLLPNDWRRIYPAAGTDSATCAGLTSEATCQRNPGCAWQSGTCSNTGYAVTGPDCDCTAYFNGGGSEQCPPTQSTACPTLSP